MAVKTTYAAKSYPTLTGKEPRYVRRDADEYRWCIVDPKTRLDFRQGTCESGDIPHDIREKVDSRAGRAFSYVEWP